MRYRKELDSARSHINTLRGVIGVMALVALGLWFGWQQAPDRLTVHIPPELRTGGVLEAGEVHPASVYTFAFYIWQQLHRWPEDGRADYPDNLWSLQAFLTPRFQQTLEADREQRERRGELRDRSRFIREIDGLRYTPDRVQATGDGTWTVWLDVEVEERIDGERVKQVFIRYPLRVVAYDIDPESNPWGLALAGFVQDPYRIDPEEEQ